MKQDLFSWFAVSAVDLKISIHSSLFFLLERYTHVYAVVSFPPSLPSFLLPRVVPASLKACLSHLFLFFQVYSLSAFWQIIWGWWYIYLCQIIHTKTSPCSFPWRFFWSSSNWASVLLSFSFHRHIWEVKRAGIVIYSS